MNNTYKTIAVCAVVALVVAWIVAYFASTNTIVRESTIKEKLGSAGNVFGEKVTFVDGASFNGGVLRGAGKRFETGTTTPASIRCPGIATSTVLSLLVNLTKNATTTARIMFVGTSTVPFATSSTAIIAQRGVVGNETFAWSATTTQAIVGTVNGAQNLICRPNDYITVNFQGGNFGASGIGTSTELDGFVSALFLTEGF